MQPDHPLASFVSLPSAPAPRAALKPPVVSSHLPDMAAQESQALTSCPAPNQSLPQLHACRALPCCMLCACRSSHAILPHQAQAAAAGRHNCSHRAWHRRDPCPHCTLHAPRAMQRLSHLYELKLALSLLTLKCLTCTACWAPPEQPPGRAGRAELWREAPTRAADPRLQPAQPDGSRGPLSQARPRGAQHSS